MILHTVNKNQDCLKACTTLAGENDAILLIEDGVYAAMADENNANNSNIKENTPVTIRIMALENDLLARGIADSILPGIETISWSQFVELACEYDKVISWG